MLDNHISRIIDISGNEGSFLPPSRSRSSSFLRVQMNGTSTPNKLINQ